MKKKDTANSGAQYAGTQPIQHAEVVLGQPAPEPAREAQKPKVLPAGAPSKKETPHKSKNAPIGKTSFKPIL